MRRKLLISTLIVGALTGGVVVAARAGGSAAPAVSAEEHSGLPYRWHGEDLGAGEHLVLVVGGAFPTRDEAERANTSIAFGDLQGYYVARTDQFVGLGDAVGGDHPYVLVTAFRTDEGARAFVSLAEAADAPALLTPRLVNLGFEYVGLGQEEAPDGSGPLLEPIPGVSVR